MVDSDYDLYTHSRLMKAGRYIEIVAGNSVARQSLVVFHGAKADQFKTPEPITLMFGAVECPTETVSHGVRIKERIAIARFVKYNNIQPDDVLCFSETKYGSGYFHVTIKRRKQGARAESAQFSKQVNKVKPQRLIAVGCANLAKSRALKTKPNGKSYDTV